MHRDSFFNVTFQRLITPKTTATLRMRKQGLEAHPVTRQKFPSRRLGASNNGDPCPRYGPAAIVRLSITCGPINQYSVRWKPYSLPQHERDCDSCVVVVLCGVLRYKIYDMGASGDPPHLCDYYIINEYRAGV